MNTFKEKLNETHKNIYEVKQEAPTEQVPEVAEKPIKLEVKEPTVGKKEIVEPEVL